MGQAAMNIGAVKGKQGDLNGAMEQYMEAKRVRTATGTLETPEGAMLLMNDWSAKSALRVIWTARWRSIWRPKRVFTATGTLETPGWGRSADDDRRAKRQTG